MHERVTRIVPVIVANNPREDEGLCESLLLLPAHSSEISLSKTWTYLKSWSRLVARIDSVMPSPWLVQGLPDAT